jgi:hypothetical protein
MRIRYADRPCLYFIHILLNRYKSKYRTRQWRRIWDCYKSRNATIGKIYVFDEIQESWETYVERVQHFFAATMSMIIIKCQLC